MNIKRNTSLKILAGAALLLVGSLSLQATPNVVVAAFATGTQGENNSQDGTYGQYTGDNLSVPYGAGTIGWDGITFDAADGSTGSAYITANFSAANNTEVLVSVAPGYNNWYFEGGNGAPGWSTGTVDGTQYHAVQFDILWDTNSALTISQFNTGDGWPTSDFLNPGVGPDYMATNSYYTAGVNVEFFSGSGGANTYIGTFQIPTNADQGWQTVTVPYSDTISGISQVAGVWFQGSFGGGAELVGNYNGAFWIDNLQLIGNLTISPSPTMNPPTPVTPGLNIFNASVGTGAYPYSDRNEVVAKTTSGLSWVDNTPTSYSFNMTGFPNGVPFSGEAYMFLVPNASYQDNAVDYNEAACFVLEIQSTPTGGQALLSYKVDEPSSETYTSIQMSSFTGGPNPPSAPGNAVPTTKVLGTYTLTFTGNDAGTLTTPDGTVGTFSVTAGTFDTAFKEGVQEMVPVGDQPQTNNYNFLIYLGGQANDASFVNKSVVYSSFTETGAPSAATVTENFVNDANLSTPALQDWTAGPTSDAAADILIPSSGAYMLSWTLPDSGYGLEGTASLNPPVLWNNISPYAPVPMYNVDTQLITSSQLQGPTNAQYFELVHRSFSQLLVLCPGQTNTPGVAPGYSGTPTPVSLNDNFGLYTVTVMAVDSNWNPVPGITDTIAITSSDPNATTPNNAALVNGSGQFTVEFGSTSPPNYTITATDQTSTNITAGTSAGITVNN